jgi:hypothetical protein
VLGIFEIGDFCPGWFLIVILLICTSQVARITGVSHLHLACLLPYYFNLKSSLYILDTSPLPDM